jgi:hypothetical protein
MNMNRKSFLARLTALVAAPFVVAKAESKPKRVKAKLCIPRWSDNPYVNAYREETIRNMNGEVVCVARYEEPTIIS